MRSICSSVFSCIQSLFIAWPNKVLSGITLSYLINITDPQSAMIFCRTFYLLQQTSSRGYWSRQISIFLSKEQISKILVRPTSLRRWAKLLLRSIQLRLKCGAALSLSSLYSLSYSQQQLAFRMDIKKGITPFSEGNYLYHSDPVL